ncbi:hypothetical protein [Rarobacter incanus]|uniref:Uncharacterized protein n=1 Tax=Rarobacter incanus TaxID=153494 RepID=A0A542SRX9_9MICO|nr:hypothetical protein [Rarobacter incanus]TQK77379.1 hypothetical protein FB389_2108 [Rarobacter incanus]
MARRYARKTGQRQQSERELTIRADFHDPPDLDKLSELLIRMALQQSGSCRSGDATRPKRSRASAGSSS